MKKIFILLILFVVGCEKNEATTAPSTCATAMTTIADFSTTQMAGEITQANCEAGLQALDDYCTGGCEPAGTADANSICKTDDGSGTYSDYEALTIEEITATCAIMVAFLGGGF